MKKKRNLIDKIEKADLSQYKWPQRTGISILRIIIRTWTKFNVDRCFQRAGGLSFSTILAIVPLMAIFAGFGGGSEVFSEGVKKVIAETLLPTSQEPILRAFESFTENSKKLGTVGLVFFLFTAVFLCNNIETHFNDLMRSRPNKELFTRAAIYLSTLIFGSLFIGASFSLTSPIVSLITSLTMEILEPITIQLLFSAGTVFFIMLVIIILINALTTAKVKFTSSLLGGFLGAVSWEIAKRFFTLWAGASVRNSVIYGSLFIIPMLFFWVYIGWTIMLISVEITYVHQHNDVIDWKYHEKGDITPYRSMLIGLEIYLYIARKFLNKEAPPTTNEILKEFKIPEDSFFKVINMMIKKDLIYLISNGKRQLIPAAPPETVSLKELLNTLSGISDKGNFTLAEDHLCAIKELDVFFDVYSDAPTDAPEKTSEDTQLTVRKVRDKSIKEILTCQKA